MSGLGSFQTDATRLQLRSLDIKADSTPRVLYAPRAEGLEHLALLFRGFRSKRFAVGSHHHVRRDSDGLAKGVHTLIFSGEVKSREEIAFF